MKLYATTTSERASKGQGGQNYVDVEIIDENRDRLIYIHTIPDGTNTRLSISMPYGKDDNGYYEVFYIPKKAKQKKDEKHVHDWDNYGKCCICGVWDTKL